MVSGRKKRNKGTGIANKVFGMQHDCFTVLYVAVERAVEVSFNERHPDKGSHL